MPERNKIYFASDFHLGIGSPELQREREQRIVRWLESIKHDAAELYLVGDIFDFWFEYSTVVPKGYIRFLGKLAELTDLGVKLTMFKGNHDMWMFGYFQREFGATIISNELVIERNGKKFYLHHGDGLGPGDRNYKILKKFFRSRLCQWLFERVHPNFGVGVANRWSQHSKDVNITKEQRKIDEQEWLVIFSREVLKTQYYDYLIFGHRHKAMEIKLGDKSRYINLGEWIAAYTYAVFDGHDVKLCAFEQPEQTF
ncbi:UDP-2,3-diacylglucosamine diphosphatase [Mucilaginibacter sp. KACC 22063]|uniref:UDP-2,3-diacylglucosamine diphosphatase n=1 Tax=Mucilaginibacter sp. KACC 22063 TaxID=3025666 RepID=UPI0023661150|nr:UDP-2,3-diacylglucosamine diphosphatase [Mucilaginibacter sp. KACC 22063]WDF57433.1 UDP-2,3-diacylglucosamine diphosphatase [Mucilaginibacter sp. KACC 22063]